MARILIYDIESTGLKADWDRTLCIGWKWLGEKGVTVKSIASYPNWKDNILDDSQLIKEFHGVMSQADMRVGYYSRGFDLKFLQAKFMRYGLPVLPLAAELDLYFVVKTNFALTRKSLDNVSKYFQLDKKKYYVTPEIWQRAAVGDPDALGKVMAHCRADIKITEQLYLKLRPLIRNHPRVGAWAPCKYCGSTKLQRRGSTTTRYRGKYYRFYCSSCGGWENRSEEHAQLVQETTEPST